MVKKQTPVAQKKAASPKINFKPPARIEDSYRKIFGQYNLHFTLLSIIAQKFKDDNLSKEDFSDVMRELSKQYKHHRTYANSTNFQAVYKYIIESHIAYCFSAGDYLCREIRSITPLKDLKSKNEDKFNSINKGDFINKTLTLIFWNTSSSDGNVSADYLLELTKEKLSSSLEFSILNYYINIRNQNMHSIKDSSIIEGIYAGLNLSSIKEKYNKIPSQYPNLTSDDALICALAWIDAGRWLCKNMLNHEQQILPEIKSRFKNLSPLRRYNAATHFMLQDLLFTLEETTATMNSLGWQPPIQQRPVSTAVV